MPERRSERGRKRLVAPAIVLLLLALFAVFLGVRGRRTPTDDRTSGASLLSGDGSSEARGGHGTPRSKVRDDRGASRPEQAGAPGLAGRVVAFTGDPVRDAAVDLIESSNADPLEGHVVLAARTQSDGSFEIARTALEPMLTEGRFLFLVATHPDYEQAILALEPSSVDGIVTMTLREGAGIHGRVTLPDGSTPSGNVEVVAWLDRGRNPTRHMIEEMNPLIRRAAVQRDGSFVVRGLIPSERYRLVGGGRGYVSWHADGGVVSEPDEAELVELYVAPLYVLDVRVTERGGRALRSSQRLFAAPWTSWTEPEALDSVDIDDPSLLLGLDSAMPPERETSQRVFGIYSGLVDEPAVGPTELSLRVPGYVPQSASVYFCRADHDDVVQHVELEPAVPGFGKVEISFASRDAALLLEGRSSERPPNLLLPYAVLHFVPETPGVGLPDGNGFYQVSVWSPSATDPIVLDGFPAGTYRVLARNCQFPGEALKEYSYLTVEPDGLAQVLIWTGDWGMIDLDVDFAAGSASATAYSGPLTVDLTTRTSSGVAVGQTYLFRFPPYEVLGLAPGEYLLTVAARGAAVSETIDVRTGTVTERGITLRVP